MTDEQTNGQTDERTDICECRCRVSFATENKKFFMDIGFRRMEPPKKAFQWLQRVQSPHFRPILSPFEAFRGPQKVF